MNSKRRKVLAELPNFGVTPILPTVSTSFLFNNKFVSLLQKYKIQLDKIEWDDEVIWQLLHWMIH